MRFWDGYKLAFQNLGRTKFRSFLTILGVMIGISAIVAFVSLGVGLQRITSDQISSMSTLTTLTVTQTPETSTMEAGPRIDINLIEKVKTMKGVEKCSGSVNIPTTVQNGESSTGAIVFGVEIDNADIEITNFQYGINLSRENEAVISSALANSFSSDHEKLLQQEITVKIIKTTEGLDYQTDSVKLTIVGIDKNDTANMVYMPISKLYDKGEFDSYSSLKVKVKSRKDITPVKTEIKNLGYQVTTIQDLIDQIDRVFLIIQIILGVIGSIGLLVSTLGIINTMTISFLERTREIGIMRAIGATRKDIKSLFLVESAVIGLLGGIGGVVLAYGFGELVNGIINYLIRSSGQKIDLFAVVPEFCGVMILLGVILSVMAGIYPTLRAQKLSPIVAIRQ